MVGKNRWIKAVLANDEMSTDEEMIEHFMVEGEMTRIEAEQWVAQRDRFLNMELFDEYDYAL